MSAEIDDQIARARRQTDIPSNEARAGMAIDTTGLPLDIMNACQIHRRAGGRAHIKRLLAFCMTGSAKSVVIFKLHGGDWNEQSKEE